MENLRCVIPEIHQVALECLDIAPLQWGEVRVKTHYSLVSPGTEGAMFNRTHIGFPDPENTYAKYPFYPGYAAVGEIVEISQGAKGFGLGDVVYYYGRHEKLGTANTLKSVVLKVPEKLDLRLVPFARLAQVAYTSLAATKGCPGNGIVAVVGLGMIGNFAAQLYRRAGAAVYAFDALQARVDWAKACGLPNCFMVDGDLAGAIAAATGGERPKIVVEATGVGALVEACLKALAYNGTVVLLGSPREPATINVYKWIHRTAARLVGAHVNLVPLMSEDSENQVKVTADILEAMTKGNLTAEPLLSRIIEPAALEENYHALEKHKDRLIGVLIDWTATSEKNACGAVPH